jgi:uncharacterized membrane protein
LGEYENLFKISSVGFFVFLNLFWILMLFISLLRWYGRILLVFAFGMAASIILAYYFIGSLGNRGRNAGLCHGACPGGDHPVYLQF